MRPVTQAYVNIYRCLSEDALAAIRYGFMLADGHDFVIRVNPDSKVPEIYQGLVALGLLMFPGGNSEDVGISVGGMVEHHYGFTRLGYEFAKELLPQNET